MGAGDTLRRVARDAKGFADKWPRQGAEQVADTITRDVAAATGGDGRFSHSRGVYARVDVSASSGGADVVGKGAGMTWLERGTRPHTVNARPGGFLRTPYGPRRTVNVSGMPAKRTWSRGVAEAMPRVRRDAEQAFAKVVG